MVKENGVSLQVDPQRRIGVTDVINMLKGLRSEATIKIVKTSEPNENKVDTAQSQSVISAAEKFNQITAVKGNTDLPQIRELNEIAALLRSMDVQQNQFGY
jgi:hypothetical protein